MAKKKQFAGKKTKLAKLPLTQALASQIESGAPFTPSSSPSRQMPHTWDEVSPDRGEPVVGTFLYLVRELAELASQLQSKSGPVVVNHRIFLPKRVPEHALMVKALRKARESLQDLRGLLSHP